MQKVALVVGAGDATGGAIARRFAREGYTACVTRRSVDKLQPLLEQIRAAGGQAEGFASDARKEDEVIALVEQIESTVGPIEVLVFNIGANVPCSILEETARKYFKVWEMACLGGFLNGREVAKRMVARAGDGHKGTIIFTGATASLRGSAHFAAFAGQARAARAGAEHGARTRTARHPRRACGGRRRHRHRVHPQQFPAALCTQGAGRHREPGSHRRQLLVPAPAAARRLDPRAGPAALDGEVLNFAGRIKNCAAILLGPQLDRT
jgi:NAD(P)-dependent dehydrogenase (short-subunit alcohol dehydrogenase family)